MERKKAGRSKDDVVSLIHVLEVDAVSARDAAQQRLLEAFARNGERVRFAMRKRTFESREIVLRKSLGIIRPSKQEGFDGVFFAGFFLDLQTSSFDLMILRAM